jgi:hypothetical protein
MIHFISYGDQKYSNSKFRIKEEAKSFGFDVVDVFGPEDLDPKFVEKTSPFIHHHRGGGYWLWKPYLLKKKFDQMQLGDYLIYADAGCHVNIHGKERFKYYLNLLDNDESGVLSFDLTTFLEKIFTTEKVFEYFGIGEGNDLIRESGMLIATILIFKKNESSIRLIDDFYKVATERPDLFSDIHNDYKRQNYFSDHRHDQSIFSILRKLHGTIKVADETYSEKWNELMHIPILATRIRN